jgi:hypothetical protein
VKTFILIIFVAAIIFYKHIFASTDSLNTSGVQSTDKISQADTLSLNDKLSRMQKILGENMFIFNEDSLQWCGLEFEMNDNKIFQTYGYRINKSNSDIERYKEYYDFPNVHVFLKDNKLEYVVSTYKLNKIRTSKGVYIGDKLEKLIKVYGKPSAIRKQKDTKRKMYDYNKNYYKISFEIENKEVVRITVFKF